MPFLDRGRQRFLFVLYRVINDADINGPPGQAGTHTDAKIAARATWRRKFPRAVDVIAPFFYGLGE